MFRYQKCNRYVTFFMKCKLKVFEKMNYNFEKGLKLKIRESVTDMLRFYLKIIFYIYIKNGY